MNWKEMLRTRADEVYHAAKGLIAMCDESKLDWKPESGTNWLTTGQLLRHIASACGLTAKGFATGEWDMAGYGIDPSWKPANEQDMLPPAEAHMSVESLADAQKRLEDDKAEFLSALEGLDEDRLNNERSTAPWGGPESPLGSHMASCITHLETHKNQLFYYLKLQGKPVNTMHLWGMA